MKRARIAALAICGLITLSASAAKFKTLILNGDARNVEGAAVAKIAKVGDHTFTHEEVKIEGGKFDGNMRDAQIVWFPWNGPGHDGAYFMDGAEDAFRKWVENGGVVWISAFDDNYRDAKGNQIGLWFPLDKHPVVVQNTGDADVDITPDGAASGLFSTPNKVDMNAITLDDNFSGLDKSWVTLATRKDNAQPAVCYLKYGKGLYLEACIDTRDAGKLPSVQPLLPNGLLFLANYASGSLAVDPNGRLPSAWGRIKARD